LACVSYLRNTYVYNALFCVQECYVPVELLMTEEDFEKLEEVSSEEEEIVEKITEVSVEHVK